MLLTFDKDFGALVFALGAEASPGVVLFRFQFTVPRTVAERIASVLQSRDDWQGMFSVVESDRIRMTPLPGR